MPKRNQKVFKGVVVQKKVFYDKEPYKLQHGIVIKCSDSQVQLLSLG